MHFLIFLKAIDQAAKMINTIEYYLLSSLILINMKNFLFKISLKKYVKTSQITKSKSMVSLKLFQLKNKRISYIKLLQIKKVSSLVKLALEKVK